MTKFTRRDGLKLLGGAIAAQVTAPAIISSARAQAKWPSQPIRAVCPYTAGSTADILPRLIFEPLSQQLGQSITIENRGGAGGTLGTAQVARAEPDGYTWLAQASAHAATPAIYPNAPYDAANDFSAVIPFGNLPNVVVIAPEKGIKSLDQLVAAAKAKPGQMTFASAGVGSSTHLAAEKLSYAGGFKAQHVPFRGGPEGLTETMTGRVDFYCCGIASALPFVRDGKLNALAVCTPQRVSALPNVPTTIEAGVPNSSYNYWCGLFVPSKTPREIVERINTETAKALQNKTLQDKLAQQGVDPMPMGAREFDDFVRKEIAVHIELVKAAGLKFN